MVKGNQIRESFCLKNKERYCSVILVEATVLHTDVSQHLSVIYFFNLKLSYINLFVLKMSTA